MKTKSKLLPLALLAACQCAYAQQIPGAGTQLRQITPPALPTRAEPVIRIERASAPAAPGAATATVRVDSLRFTGSHVYPDAELLAVTRFSPGATLTLADLNAMAARITERYRSNGYFVARAYLPAQDISGHVVTIAVVEGNYGKVTLRNNTRLADRVPNRALEGLESGDLITIEPLEHRLLLLSDIPGVVVSSTLVPGERAGTSDLIVDVAPGRRISGMVDADNAGNPYTGEVRVGALVNFNNPLGLGDVLSLRALTSGDGLNYGRLAYQLPVGPATVGVSYSRLEYELGKQFADLGANGTAEVASVYGSLPLIRSRRSNLYLGLAYEDKTLEDRFDLMPGAGRLAGIGAGIVSLHGNHVDNLGGGGMTSFYASLTAGSLDIETPAALAADAASARTNGSYNKVWFNVARVQRVTDAVSVRASLTGQLASKNLDPSEKFVLGGMDAVRAYPQGEAFGDEGLLLSLEARLRLAGFSDRMPGQLYLLGFVDAGRVTINKDPWYIGDNHRNLNGVGTGLAWEDPGNFAVRLYYARKLGSEPALSAPDKSGRVWIQAIKYF